MVVEKVKVKKTAGEGIRPTIVEEIEMAKKLSSAVALISVMLGALFTWASYKLVYEVIGGLLMSFGIYNDYYQNIIIIVGSGLILYFLFKKNLGRYFK